MFFVVQVVLVLTLEATLTMEQNKSKFLYQEKTELVESQFQSQ